MKIPIPSIHQNQTRGNKSTTFGIWKSKTIENILTNPTYMGNLTQCREKKVSYKSKKRIRTKKMNGLLQRENVRLLLIKKLLKQHKIYIKRIKIEVKITRIFI